MAAKKSPVIISSGREKVPTLSFRMGKLLFLFHGHVGKDISPGVERNILKLIGVTTEQFRKLK